MSIFHRITGFALTVGILYFMWWIISAAAGPEAYDIFMRFSGTPLGIFMLMGWSLCLYYHLANGIRHLFWDAGALLELKNAYAAGVIVMAFTVIMTVGTWVCVFLEKGLWQ
jgi:succinate dehydrogenase / fumarate reductase cytochrome b subunit